MKTIAIIGGMYGDEGKGLMTDYMCDQMLKNHTRGAVVRFQGGAQSGHTVVTPDGHRHIFSHFGGGTLLGVPTILSSKFVCNPILFNHEFCELDQLTDYPKVMVDEESYISTVYDVEFNRELERSRGDKRHGSVGVGFGETIEREEVAGLSLRYKDLHKDKSFILNRLEEIRQYYIKKYDDVGLSTDDIIRNKYISSFMLTDLSIFRSRTEIYKEAKLDFMVFEGGQGLGLDMEYGSFPHVTRSRTGMLHAKEFCDKHGTELEKVVYVIRAYTTRHGAGPLRNEVPVKEYKHVIDETNRSNEFQGDLRFAPLDYDKFTELTGIDSMANSFTGDILYAMTCVDQMTNKNKIFMGNTIETATKEDFIGFVKGAFDLYSFGPTRNDVRRIT